MPLALRPVRGFPAFPGWSSPHRLLWPVCPTLPDTAQASLPIHWEGQCGSPVAVWLLGWGRVGFRTRFPYTRGLRTGPSTLSRCLGPTDATFRVHQPQTFAGLQFSWHPRPRMPALVWSYLAFATYRLTPAHPFLTVRILEVGLLLTTRSCPLEADQPRAAWRPEPPGLGDPFLVMGHIQ